MVIILNDECRDQLLRKKSRKRQAGADAFYRMASAIREEYLSQDQANDLGKFTEERLRREGYLLSEELMQEDTKLRGVLIHQAHRCHGDCHGNGGCDHHVADPLAIVDSVVDQQIGHGCENCGSGETTEEIKEANLAIGQFKIAAKKKLITQDQFFNVLQWLRACYGYEPIMEGKAMTEGGATVHDLAKYREDHPRPKKDVGTKTFDPDSPIFPRLIAAIQSGSFLPDQAKELNEALSEKWGIKFIGLPAKREAMREHAAKRRLQKIEPGEVAVIVAMAKDSLGYKESQITIEWLHALYEI